MFLPKTSIDGDTPNLFSKTFDAWIAQVRAVWGEHVGSAVMIFAIMKST